MIDFVAAEIRKSKNAGECLAALYHQCDYNVLGFVRENWVDIYSRAKQLAKEKP